MAGRQTAFAAALARYQRVAVDTNCCIYFLADGSSDIGRLAAAVFERAARRELIVDLAGIVRLELLIHPYRNNDSVELMRMRRLFERHPGVVASPISEGVLTTAAQIRAYAGLRAPDALVAGSALVHGCEAIVGTDGDFRKLERIGEGDLEHDGRIPEFVHLDEFVD